jgi:hypothetical protein
MFRLNRNKKKINRSSLTESIFCYFSESLGLFRSSLVFVFHWRRREEMCTTCLNSFLGSNCTSICTYTSTNTVPEMEVTCGWVPHTTHRVAMATFRRTLHHDGKISPAWWVWGGGARPSPFTNLPWHTKLWFTLQLRGQIPAPYFYSTLIFTLWCVLSKNCMQILILSMENIKYKWVTKTWQCGLSHYWATLEEILLHVVCKK